ncbi:MAG TPA: hypothetical protein DCF49_05565 [Lachnospiraceae bacterium]|nr:hypothetical protein [Lachnospiraceae bacterium]
MPANRLRRYKGPVQIRDLHYFVNIFRVYFLPVKEIIKKILRQFFFDRGNVFLENLFRLVPGAVLLVEVDGNHEIAPDIYPVLVDDRKENFYIFIDLIV